MQQESHDDRLNQLEGILSEEFKAPPGESAAQLASIRFQRLVQEVKDLTSDQLRKLSQLAPRYLSFAITKDKQTLVPLYKALESPIDSTLPLDSQVIFYNAMAESCAHRGWWFNSHPAAEYRDDMDVLYYCRIGLSLADNKPFEAIGHRLYAHAIERMQADIHQPKWLAEKNALITECKQILSPDSKSSFNTLRQFAARLAAAIQHFTFIESDERRQLWATWSTHWYTEKEEVEHQANEGDGIFQRFREAIFDCLIPENKRSAEDLNPLCQQQRQMIQTMARYGEPEKARWQLHRYCQFLTKIRNNLIAATGAYYKGKSPHWEETVKAAITAGDALDLAVTGFPKTPPEKIQQWLVWRQRFQQYNPDAPTLAQTPGALRHNAQQARRFWADILASCIDLLGPPPCPVAWVPIGSLGREEPLPRSDFDGLILVRDVNYPTYFDTLIHLIWFHGRLLPASIFPLEHQDFKAMLNNPTRLLNTPEALAHYFWALMDEALGDDHLQFSVGFPGALFLEEPPEKKPTHRLLWQYQQELLPRYQTALTQGAPEESARRLARWIMHHLVSPQTKNAVTQLKSFLDPMGVAPLTIRLKDDLLRPLTWWCLAMKLAYRLPDTNQSSHAILEALKAQNIFPLAWLQQLQQWETQIHYWRWQKHQPTAQELQTAFHSIYSVLNLSTLAWFGADEKQHSPASLIKPFIEFFNSPWDFDPDVSVLTQLSDKLTTLLPAPPCPFWPFVLPLQESSNRYMLGIAVADEKYNSHPYFSYWAEGIVEMMKINRATPCSMDISLVYRFLRGSALPSHFLIGTVAQLAAQVEIFAPRLMNTGPMRWLSREEKPMIPLHAHLNWQRDLLALTCEQPDGKAPCAQLSWPEAKGIRYLSPQLTQRLFHMQDKDVGKLNSAQRSATPGQSDVWRLIAKDFSQCLPECNDNTIVGYLKTYPTHLWRQWQHLTLAKRLIPHYGFTGSIATLQYDAKSEPIPVWFSSPAGVTFCSIADHKASVSSPDIQIMDEKGQSRWAQYVAQLDPYAFTQLVFLTFLLVHEDDQRRNLGWQSFINKHGATVFRIIPFDTDTCLGPSWIRTADGKIQIKLKSLALCLEAMEWPLDTAAFKDFLALDPVTVLEAWLQEINVVHVPGNTLPGEALDALYQRWQQLRDVLNLPKESSDPMAPTFPRTHLDLLELLDSVLGQAYREAHRQHTNPLERFNSIAQDYVMMGNMRVSRRSGVLRGASVALFSRAVQASPISMTTHHALIRCQQYRQQQEKVQPFIEYLKQQASQPSPLFENQITRVIGDIPELNQQTQKQMEKHQQQQHDLEHAMTRASQWEPLCAPDLKVTIIAPDNKLPSSLMEWETTCTHTAKPGIRLVKTTEHAAWEVSVHNGKSLVLESQWMDRAPENKEGWDLRAWQKHLTPKPNLLALRTACQMIYATEYRRTQELEKLLAKTEETLKNLAEQRKARVSRQPRPETKSSAALSSKSDPDFLLDLQDIFLRQTVLSQLQWGKLPAGDGLNQLLRLLELGGLTRLNLQDCAVSEKLVLACVQNSPELSELNLSGCDTLTDNTLVKIAVLARNLTRLAARGLPNVKALWQGLLWLTHTPLRFPHLTHADFRDCKNLDSLHLQAPALRYLHLGGCGTPTSQEWILETPQLKIISLARCNFSRLSIHSDVLETLDASGSAALTLPNLKAMLTPERWPGVRLLTLDGCEQLRDWQLLSRYPFLTPLADEWMSTDKLAALQTVFLRPQVAADLPRLPSEGRWRLQVGLMLFLWQQPQDLLNRAIESLSDVSDIYEYEFVRQAALTAVGQISVAQPALAEQALTPCLALLKSSDYWWWGVHRAVVTIVGQIIAAQPALAGQVLTPCLALIDSSWSAHHKTAVMTLGQIIAVRPALAKQALTSCLILLKDTDANLREAAATAIGQIITAQSVLAEQALIPCLRLLKDSYSEIRQAVVTAVGQIVVAQPALAKQALIPCLALLKDSESNVRQAVVTAVGQIIIAQPALAEQALIPCLALLKDSESDVRQAAVTAVGQMIVAQPALAVQVLTPCMALLEGLSSAVHEAVAIVVGQMIVAQPALSVLTPCMALLEGLSSAVPEAVATALGQMIAAQPALTEQVLISCLAWLKDSGANARQAVATAFGRIIAAQPALAQEALIPCLALLKDSSWTVRRAAVTAIGQMSVVQPALARQALTPCLTLLKDKDSKPDIRQAVATALGQMSATQPVLAEQALNPCLALLKDSESDVRQAATIALWQIIAAQPTLAKQVLTPCLALLKDSDSSVRQAAATALTQMSTAQPKIIYLLLTKLSELLNNPDKSIALNAIHLFTGICANYYGPLGQSLGDYITYFLQQWFSQHPDASKSLPAASSSESLDEKKQTVPFTNELVTGPEDVDRPLTAAPKSTKSGGNQANQNSIVDGVIETKKRGSEADSKLLVGVIPGSEKELKLLEKQVPGDGNCGFNALKITRQQIFNMLSSRVADPASRRLISAEIHEFFLSGQLNSMQGVLDEKSYHQLSELKGYRDTVTIAEEKFNTKKNEINQLLDKQPVNTVYLEDKSAPLMDRLRQRLEFYKPAGYTAFINALNQLHDSVNAAQQNYQAQLESEPTYMAYANAYLIDGERPKLWLGYQTALLYARFSVTPINLYIWKKITPDGKQIACDTSHYHYAGEGCVTYHILHTNGYTHFNILEPAETARLSQQSLLVQHSGSSASSSSRYDPTATPGFHV